MLLAAPVARAADPAPCYRPADIEAEQAMVYQSELMVLSDTCGGDTYRDFTVHNREVIVAYQRQLMDRFRRTGARSPVASLDSYLTRIANETSIRDAREPAQALCDRSVDFLTLAKGLDKDEFRRHVAALAAANGAAYRRCGK